MNKRRPELYEDIDGPAPAFWWTVYGMSPQLVSVLESCRTYPTKHFIPACTAPTPALRPSFLMPVISQTDGSCLEDAQLESVMALRIQKDVDESPTKRRAFYRQSWAEWIWWQLGLEMCIRIHLPNTRHGLRAPERERERSYLILYTCFMLCRNCKPWMWTALMWLCLHFRYWLKVIWTVFVARFVCINAMYACCVL